MRLGFATAFLFDTLVTDSLKCSPRIECGTCLEELGAKNSSKVKGISQCEVKYKYLAVDFPRHTETVLEDTVCHNIPQQVCNSHWVVDAKGDKVWKQDPSTCQTFEVTKCTKVLEKNNRSSWSLRN